MTNATQLIITADDFGAHMAINEAVEAAHTHGVLSAASLMMGGGAVDDAIERARSLPNLRVGLHITLVEGQPLTRCPALTQPNGMFLNNLVKAGVVWFFSPKARRQLKAEMTAQFEAFKASGLALDHVNAHNHMHMHPTVLSYIIELSKVYRIQSVRLPRQPGSPPWLTPLLMLMRWRLDRAGIKTNDYVLGLADSGHLNTNTMLKLLQKLPKGVIELYCHPATKALPDTLSGYDPVGELAALQSDVIVSHLARESLKPVGFSDVFA